MAKGIYAGANTTEKLVEFTDIITPTSWTVITNYQEYEATNDYGTWNIQATSSSQAGYSLDKAFDNGMYTSYASGNIKSGSENVTITCPTGMSIAPTSITIKHGVSSSGKCGSMTLRGLKEDGVWENIMVLDNSDDNITETATPTGETFYTSFQLYATNKAGNSSYWAYYLFELQITSGTLKLASKNNIAHKVTKAYVGVDSELPNLVVNGDFSNGLEGWTPLYKNYLTASVFEDGYRGKCVSLETIEDETYSHNMFMNYLTDYTFVENHIYYASVYVKSDIEKQIVINANSVNNEGSRYHLFYNEFTANTSWQKISGLGTSEGNSNEGYVDISFLGAPKNTFYADCFELYDLTEMFGSGNEPTQEWCDTNLEALENKSVARKVKKGYIGASPNLIVNGDFSDGLEGWRKDGAGDNFKSVTIEENALKLILTQIDLKTWHTMMSKESFVLGNVNDLFYVTFEYSYAIGTVYEGHTNACRIWLDGTNSYEFIQATSDTEKTKYSSVFALQDTNLHTFRFGLNGGENQFLTLSNIKLYNLTATYGAGNEPTAEWCDANVDVLEAKGVAQQFYSSETLVPFTSNPVPTTWTNSSDYLSATAANDYGEWKVEADSVYEADQKTSNAFDGNSSTYYRPTSLTSDTSYATLTIYAPNGVTINPTQISITSYRTGNTGNLSTLYGITVNGAIEELGTLTISSQDKPIDTFDISSEQFYKGFMLRLFRYNSSVKTPVVYDFKITAGTLKIE